MYKKYLNVVRSDDDDDYYYYYYYDYDVDVDGICRNYKVKDFSPTGAARTVSFDLARIYR